MKTLIFIPTYNESGNIERLVRAIFALNPDYHILIVDDQSPDGTAGMVRNMQKEFAGLALITRNPPRGRGLAGKDGFMYGLIHKYQILVEMDADFSHNPQTIPELVEAAQNADVVIGSRYILQGTDHSRSKSRRTISIFANLYIKLLLGLPVKDCTSGFRAFRYSALQKINPETLMAKGPETVEEILYRCHNSGCKIVEIPIDFFNRETGESKLHLHVLLSILFKVLKLRLFSRF